MNQTGIAAKGALAVGVLVASLTLSGCFPNPLDQISEGVVEDGVEKLIEDTTGSEVDLESGALPADFPTEVPVPDRPVQSGTMIKTEEGAMWNVHFDVDDGAAAAEEARQALLAAGWTEEYWTEGSGMVGGMFKKGDLGVNISAMDDGGDAMLLYSVIKSAE